MRVEDTLQYMTDFYPSIFPTRKHCLNHLFCVIGNGYEWINGELVDKDDKYEKRYKLKKPIHKAEFKNEEEWERMYQFYTKLNKETGIDIPFHYHFYWYSLSKEYSKLYNYPEDIKPDWKMLLKECKQMLIEDGIEV